MDKKSRIYPKNDIESGNRPLENQTYESQETVVDRNEVSQDDNINSSSSKSDCEKNNNSNCDLDLNRPSSLVHLSRLSNS